MASRILAPSMRALQQTASMAPLRSSRTFQSSSRLLDASSVAAAPARKPVGAFRGGMFGFLLGSTFAGAGTYYYILEEYKVSNELLTEDIYALQAAVQKIHTYVSSLEEKVDAMEKKKK
ncbi:hypothetical protein JMJ35_002223 [Cladonia borealis]|uniref:Uncharacterized protein n=1 Tax=Cladonia borealis TaxID=184061 RepID=A0AA39V6S0_9LECA|nr:hypothetical protein JMJ35_002223 [Cladonia borealis]